jgi:hypothetical protein
VAYQIKWTVVLWNLDDPRTYTNPNPVPNAHDPLSIPVSMFDFLRPHSFGGPLNLFDSPLVAPYIKPGNRLCGSASVICPDCGRGRTFIVYIEWGKGGWFAEISGLTSGGILSPKHLLKEEVGDYCNKLLVTIPESARVPIGEQ